MARILHVSEAMGGGIESAIRDYVASAPDLDHEVLFCRRGPYRTGDLELAGFARVCEVRGGAARIAHELNLTLRDDPPDLVHLHSAWAGLVGRLVHLVRQSTVPLIYSPHSYYFDRRDISSVSAATAYLIERTLASRVIATAAVSPFEKDQAEGLGSVAVYVPNAVRVNSDLESATVSGLREKEIVGVGRLSPQKDPLFFAEVKRCCDTASVLKQYSWTWIGGGDTSIERSLRCAGVEVTGWVPRADALRRLARAEVYLHTAAWEGSPISLLEVAALRTPAVVRSIPALVSLGYPADLVTPQAVAHRLYDATRLDDPMRLVDPKLELQRQQDSLQHLYKMALDSGVRRQSKWAEA